MTKKLIALMAALLLALSVAGCGTPAAAAPSQAQGGKLIIGLDDQFPPMGFRDDQNNIVGFDIDLATEVAKRLGLEAVPTPIDWSAKELELNNGKVDVLWNGMTITDARKESMLMSPAYVMNAQVVVVGADGGLNTIADLAGKKVAMQDGSSAQEAYAKCAAAGKEAQLVTSAENVTLLQDLKIGRIDAVVVDKVVADYYLAQNGEGKLRLLDEELAAEEYGFAFKKGNDQLANQVMAELQKMVEDGTAAKISEKWFGENRVVFDYKG